LLENNCGNGKSEQAYWAIGHARGR